MVRREWLSLPDLFGFVLLANLIVDIEAVLQGGLA
jgi:hypothetical protein